MRNIPPNVLPSDLSVLPSPYLSQSEQQHPHHQRLMRAAQEILPIVQIEVVEKTVRSENAQVQCIPEVLNSADHGTIPSKVMC